MRDDIRAMAEEDQRSVTNMCTVLLLAGINEWKAVKAATEESTDDQR